MNNLLTNNVIPRITSDYSEAKMNIRKKFQYQSDCNNFCPFNGFLKKDSAKEITDQKIDFGKLNPYLRALLVTDGTVTKTLETFFWEPINVETILHEESILSVPVNELNANPGDHVLQRFVSITGINSGRLYALAESYLLIDGLDRSLREELLVSKLGIGRLLRDRKLETYRSILRFYMETADHLTYKIDELKNDEQFLSRDYVVCHSGLPLMFIREKFPMNTYRDL